LPIIHFLARARGVDLREVGTGNVGGSNLWRQVGPRLGSLGIALDIGKGVVPPLIARLLDLGATAEVAAGMAAVAGQMWPAPLRFQGGRGNSAAAGALLVLSPMAMAIALVLFLVLVAPRVWSRLRKRQMGPSSVAVPLAVIIAMASYIPTALALGIPEASVLGAAALLLVLARRATAPWPVDPATGLPPKRSLTALLLLDRPSWQPPAEGPLAGC